MDFGLEKRHLGVLPYGGKNIFVLLWIFFVSWQSLPAVGDGVDKGLPTIGLENTENLDAELLHSFGGIKEFEDYQFSDDILDHPVDDVDRVYLSGIPDKVEKDIQSGAKFNVEESVVSEGQLLKTNNVEDAENHKVHNLRTEDGNMKVEAPLVDSGLQENDQASGLSCLSEKEGIDSIVSKWVCGCRTRFVFLFANKLSAGGASRTFTQDEGYRHKSIPNLCVDVHVYEITEAEEKEKGMLALKQTVETLVELGVYKKLNHRRLVRAIAIGGDGTMAIMCSEMDAYKVPLDYVVAGVVGFGTGNDFSHSYRWSKVRFLYEDPMETSRISAFVSLWFKASVVKHDVWNVIFDSNGEYYRWNSQSKSLVAMESNDTGSFRRLQMKMYMYFGIGYDGFVGSTFDIIRGKSRVINRINYGLAFFRHVFRKIAPICESIDSIFMKRNPPVVLLSNNEKYSQVPRLDTCSSITFLNIKTIIGGIPLWKTSQCLGTLPPLDPSMKTQYDRFVDSTRDSYHKDGDEKLEIFSMSNRFLFPKAVIDPTNIAGRIMQTGGPLVVSLKKSLSYMCMQVDGEYFCTEGLFRFAVTHSRQVNVLKHS